MFVARNRIVGTFDTPETARSCFAGLRRGQLFRPATTIWVKPPRSQVEIAYTPADARETLLRGLAFGGTLGFFGAALIGLVAVQAADAPTALAWLAAGVGLIVGSLLGALVAPTAEHPAMNLLEAEEPVSITVETTDPDDREWAADLLSSAHAHVQRRAAFEDHRGPISFRPA
jgi:hypothetical protein